VKYYSGPITAGYRFVHPVKREADTTVTDMDDKPEDIEPETVAPDAPPSRGRDPRPLLLPGEDAVVERLARQGLQVVEIARILNRNTSSIWGCFKRLKIDRPKKIKITLEISAKLSSALDKAAKRRNVEAAELAIAMLTGVLSHGAVDHATRGIFND
jgi:hypothetical protein